MHGHIEVKDAPPIMRNDEEAEENAEVERRHGEEVHRGNCFTVVAKERRPTLCRFGPWRSPKSGHTLSLQNRP
jgi:hypothetical protein